MNYNPIGSQQDLEDLILNMGQTFGSVGRGGYMNYRNIGDMGMNDEFENNNSLSGICPAIDKILHDTFGCIVYQEQVMKIVQVVFKMSLGEADMVRRAIGRKDPELMKKMVEDMKHHDNIGISEKDVERILNTIEGCSGYLFNKSHSAAYAYTAYQTAYLKTHYPKEFYCALLNANIDQEKTLEYLKEIRGSNIPVKYPDIIKSEKKWKVEGDGLRCGFSMIRGVGNVRFSKPTTNDQAGFKEFLRQNPALNKQVCLNLVKAGCFEISPRWGIEYIEWFKEANNRKQFIEERLSFFKGNEKKQKEWQDKLSGIPSEPNYYDSTVEDVRNYQIEVLGMSSMNSFVLYDDTLAQRDKNNKLCQVDNIRTFISQKKNPTILIEGKTQSGNNAKFILTVTEEIMEKAKKEIKQNDVLVIKTNFSNKAENPIVYFGRDYIHAKRKAA